MIFGSHESNTLEQFAEIKAGSVKAALMADGHYGYIMPVGGVAAYDQEVSVNGVGFDIACGNCAIKTNLTLKNLIGIDACEAEANPFAIYSNPFLNNIADQIASSISFGLGRSNKADDAPVDHPLFLDSAWYSIPNIGFFREDVKDKARRQLGTVGSGNHYVDLFVDRNDDHIWVGVHFGSRGLGHTIASNFLAIGQGGTWGDRAREVETKLVLGTTAGDEYWALMELAGQYAYVGREWVARTVIKILGGIEIDMVHNHHNFAWKEVHTIEGEAKELIVIRKGATPAFPGQRGFVGGSMGDDAVILQGTESTGNEELRRLQSESLFSTVHGAGRVMSRAEAAGKRDRSGRLKRNKKTNEIVNAGKVTPVMMESWMKNKGVILRGGGLDESPHVYRRLPEVLTAQKGTVEVLSNLKPLVVVMAGAHEIDPYKD
jgi:tRNA-splicing ligase RtcB